MIDGFSDWLFSGTYLSGSRWNRVTANPRIVAEAQTWRTFLAMSNDLTTDFLTLPEDTAVTPVTCVIQVSTSIVSTTACGYKKNNPYET